MCEEKNIIYLLKVIGDKINSGANRELKKYGLTMTQTNIIAFLMANDGASSQKEIEANCDVSHPTVVSVVAQLEERGLIESKPSVDDRRFKIITLTDKARELISESTYKLENFEKSLFSALTDDAEEEAVFRRGVETLYNILTKDGH